MAAPVGIVSVMARRNKYNILGFCAELSLFYIENVGARFFRPYGVKIVCTIEFNYFSCFAVYHLFYWLTYLAFDVIIHRYNLHR